MIRTFKKTLWNGSDWITMNFYELKGDVKTIEWCKQHYSKTQYGGTWWTTFGSICMNEKIYIHWKLME